MVPLKFRMAPKDDISSRADFSYDLVRSLGKAAEESIDAMPEISDLRKKAKIQVSFTASLSAVDLVVRVTPHPDAPVPAEELAKVKKAISEKVHEMMKSRMSELLETAMKSAHARM